MDNTFLSDHKHKGQEWKSCTLCRSHNQSKSVLYRSLQRKVDWELTNPSKTQENGGHTSVDEAFTSVLQYMNSASRQCKRFYKTCGPKSIHTSDKEHLCRFHPTKKKPVPPRNPLQRAENVDVRVAPGTYAVTMGEWSSGQHQTHIVDVHAGQCVNLDFIM